MGYDIFKGKNPRDWARGEAPPRGSWEYAGVGSMWDAGASLVKTNLKAAIDAMQTIYKRLSRHGADLRKMLVAGHKVSPSTLDTYHKAVKDYLRFGRDVFTEAEKHKLGIEQIVLRDGKPVPDPSNKLGVKTLRISGPLMPITFTAGGTVAGDDDVGFVPLILAPLIPFAIKGVLVVSLMAVGGYVAANAIEKIKIAIFGPDKSALKLVDEKLEAEKKLVARGRTPEEAKREVEAEEKEAKEPKVKWWHVLLGGARNLQILGMLMAKQTKKTAPSRLEDSGSKATRNRSDGQN